MTTDVETEAWLAKAMESLAGAASEHTNGRYNNATNRCYYACFQAAIAALLAAGITPSNPHSGWGHAFVQAQFAGQLIGRRKLYPAELRNVLSRLLSLRQTADYEPRPIPQIQATRILRQARAFVAAIEARGGEPR